MSAARASWLCGGCNKWHGPHVDTCPEQQTASVVEPLPVPIVIPQPFPVPYVPAPTVDPWQPLIPPAPVGPYWLGEVWCGTATYVPPQPCVHDATCAGEPNVYAGREGLHIHGLPPFLVPPSTTLSSVH